MISAPVTSTKTGNLFLDALSSESRSALLPHLRSVVLPNRFQCSVFGRPATTIFFPLDGLISIVGRLHDGGAHEVRVVGRDGSLGALAVLFDGPTLFDSFVQIPGTHLEMDADAFANQLQDDAALRALLLRFAHASFTTIAQSSICNGTHSIVQRSARWLLLAHDRVSGDVIRLTHELLGEMLNVRRAGITEAALHLRETGAIRYTRGNIGIASRSTLEELSCECYTSINDRAAAVLGYDIRKRTGPIRERIAR